MKGMSRKLQRNIEYEVLEDGTYSLKIHAKPEDAPIISVFKDFPKFSANHALKLSFIECHEEQEAKEFIEKHLGFEAPRMAGYHLAIKIYYQEKHLHAVKDEKGKQLLDVRGNAINIELPESANPYEKYRSVTGLVVSAGPLAYVGKRFGNVGPWCKVGDFVMFPANEGHKIIYRDVPFQIIPDDKVLAVVEDPTYITRN